MPPAPLLDDDATLAIDLLRVQRDATGEVAQGFHPPGDDALTIGRHLEHVHRLVEARVRIHVRSKTRPDRLEVAHQLPRPEVRGPVERHVLEQVREAALIVGLVDRARLDGEPQHCAIFRKVVSADKELQAVG